ncbi:MAG TPA: hypothetical protein VMZ52_20310 [Bryobacteraceae bacterium]|nr:hypothetical protein [Bryobacteraceae bacterium]
MKLNLDRWTTLADSQAIGPEEDGCAEDPLEAADESPVFLAAGLHTEGLQHFGRCAEPDRLALLLNGERRQEDRHQAVLAEWDAEFRVPGHLEDEVAISTLIEQLILGQPTDRKTAQYEWSRTEAKRLSRLVAILPDELNPLCLFQLLFRYDEVWAGPSEYGSGGLKTRAMELRQNDHLVTRSERVIKTSFGGSK